MSKNRERDRKNHTKLRKMGWKVIRLWKHNITRDFERCIERIISAVKGRSYNSDV
ncbi:MAG: DUF559 domain-containing protein [Bacillota bacterium]